MLPVVENTASPPENKFKSRTLDKPIAYHRPHKHVCLSKAHISQSTYPTTYNTNHDSPSHLVLFKLSDDTIISSLTTILLFSLYLRFLFLLLVLLLQIPSPLLLYKYSARRALTQEKARERKWSEKNTETLPRHSCSAPSLSICVRDSLAGESFFALSFL